MVRLKIAGPVYVEYEASPLEYQIEDNLAKIGTALGPAEIDDVSKRELSIYRGSIKKVNGLSVILCKGIEVDKNYSPISISNLLKRLGNDENCEQWLILEKEQGITLNINKLHKSRLETDLYGKDKQLLEIKNNLDKLIKKTTNVSLSKVYETAIKAIQNY